jgi:methylglyoxal synthase
MLKSGPLGGDQQMGALITEGGIDLLVFFVDPLSPHPHDVDIKALLRVAILNDVPFACNEETATLLVRALDRG